MNIYCTGCKKVVYARLTNGVELYPDREDLKEIPFWICNECSAFVGTHHKTEHPMRPLGFLAGPEMRKWRVVIHGALDPLWKSGKIKRGQAYAYISNRFGRRYHTSALYTIEQAKQVYDIVLMLKNDLDPGPFNR